MQAYIERWDDGLGIRIPKDVADRAGIAEGSHVEITVLNGRLVVLRAVRPSYTLEDLLVGMTPEAMRETFDSGPETPR